jgi:hypothetical protein
MSFAYLEFLLVNALDFDVVFFGAAALPLAAFFGADTDGFLAASGSVAVFGAELVTTIDFSDTDTFPFCSTTTT